MQIRLCEESLIAPISNGEVKCPVHLCTGQEAVAAGVCAALSPTDYVFGNHRSHGHFLAHGGTIKELIAEVYCKETGCSRGRGGSMHLCKPATGMLGSAPIVAGTISLALGSALASAICQDKKVTVSFFGDGATGEGVLYESFNFAALKKLPIIFACENNLYSTHMSIRECRANGTIYKSGLPFSVPSFRVDGNDVLAVFAVAKKAALACRSGKGPVFIEFMTYRFRGHVGADDNVQGVHTDIRPKKEIAGWFKKDPIRRFERYLLNGVFGKAELLKIKEQVDAEINDAFNFALKSPCPQESDLGKYVFKK
ncbi:MAG: thiamine pyrophosphate-dependent dehydrogenase E1 component subunit alpha [Candidatus Margulisiibacteriota bacterium]